MTRHRRSATNAVHWHLRFVCSPFMRDISIALSVKFLLLGALYYAFFDDSAKQRVEPDGAAAAQAILGASVSLSEVRRDR
jgi:hypothetical protein